MYNNSIIANLHSYYKYFTKKIYNTPYIRNVISNHSVCSGIEIYLGLPRFAYYNVDGALLNYMQYKFAFTHHIDIYRI